MMARSTRRPMRPKPLIATFTAMTRSLPLQTFLGRGDRGIGGDAEMLVEIGPRRRGAEPGHADEAAVGADVVLPPEGARGLDGDAHAARAYHALAIGNGLPLEQFPAGQGHHRRADALGLQLGPRLDRDRDLGAG